MLKMSFSILLLGLSLTAFSSEKSLERTDLKMPVFSTSAEVTEQKEEKGRQDFTLVNQTGKSICWVYVSPDYDNNWGRDLLGSTSLSDGNSAYISLNGFGDHCTFDVKIVACDNGGKVEARYNLCALRTLTIQ